MINSWLVTQKRELVNIEKKKQIEQNKIWMSPGCRNSPETKESIYQNQYLET